MCHSVSLIENNEGMAAVLLVSSLCKTYTGLPQPVSRHMLPKTHCLLQWPHNCTYSYNRPKSSSNIGHSGATNTGTYPQLSTLGHPWASTIPVRAKKVILLLMDNSRHFKGKIRWGIFHIHHKLKSISSTWAWGITTHWWGGSLLCGHCDHASQPWKWTALTQPQEGTKDIQTHSWQGNRCRHTCSQIQLASHLNMKTQHTNLSGYESQQHMDTQVLQRSYSCALDAF